MMDIGSSRRRQIMDLLEVLSSEEKQLAYERNVPRVHVTNELLSMWFDDQYDPELLHSEAYFTPEEITALAEFHKFYDESVSKLPASQGTVRTWHASPVWGEVMQKAKDTLSKIAA